jgi:Flp pilus assembly protein TadG
MLPRPLNLHTRSQRGSIGILMASSILIAVIAIGALAADVSHNITVRTELQNAADAAALAGAKALVNPSTSYNAEQYALQVAAANNADGKPVATDDKCTVFTQIELGSPGEVGSCQVTASRTINNMLASIFGRPTDTITVVSKASASTSVVSVEEGILFPLAVSIDAVPTKGKDTDTLAAYTGYPVIPRHTKSMLAFLDAFITPAFAKSDKKDDDTTTPPSDTTPPPADDTTSNGNGSDNGNSGSNGSATDISYPPLKTLQVGDTIHLVINGDKIDNAGWTSFTEKETNSDWLHHVVDQYLDLETPDANSKDYTIPACTIGDAIYLTNGVKGFKDFGKDATKLSALKAQKCIYLPVVEGDKFNQSTPLIGWVAVKIENTYINNQTGCVQEFVGTILKAPIRGRKGDIPPVPSGDNQSQVTLQNMSPSAVRLVSTNS